MSRAINFSAGPAALPAEVLSQAAEEMLDWHGCGQSVMEMSHRGKEFISIAEAAEADLRELLAIPANYKVLFLQGGATLQFEMIPINLLRGKTSADYVNTGEWAKKAIKEAKPFCDVNVIASSEDKNFNYAPGQSTWKLNKKAAYVHYTANETIGGVEFHWVPDLGKLAGDVPLVCDMSSNFLSRPVDVSQYGLIYAGAQKNAGPAGVTVAIVRDELLARIPDDLPTMLDYRTYAEHRSMYNTPPVFSIYVLMLVTRWLRDEVGGLETQHACNVEKAALIYDAIDGSNGFYRGHADVGSRSLMNVTWTLPTSDLENRFVAEAAAGGLVELKGHRNVGGIRASLYNAMPLAGAHVLAGYMRAFAASRS